MPNLRAALLTTLLLIGAAACGGPRLERFEESRELMGTGFRIVLYAPDAATAEAALVDAWRRIEELEDALSDYDQESELSRLSARSRPRAPAEALEVSDDLWQVLVAAAEVSRETDGAFDVTVGPFVRLWRRAVRQGELPSRERLAEAAEAVGHENLVLDATLRRVHLRAAGMRLDLGGIAKGFALDEALEVLVEHGLGAALVDGGGDLVVGDAPPGRSAWHIELDDGEGRSPLPLELVHCAVATSGDAYRFLELDGMRYSHIIDPRTGLGLTTRTAVSIIAPSAMVADAAASAACVMGPVAGLAWVEQRADLEARFVTAQKAGADACQSSGLAQRMATRTLP